MSTIAAAAGVLRAPARGLVEALDSLDLTYLIPALSFCLVVLHGFDASYVQTLIGFALVLFALEREVVRTWWFWAVLGLASTLELTRVWQDVGNHNFVITYWTWVMACAFVSRQQAAFVILFNARFFLVFIFLAAVVQKYLSPSYLSGEMFEMKILTSDGFRNFAIWVGVDPSTLAAAKAQIALLSSPAAEVAGNAVAIPSTDHVRNVALWVTWYDFYVQIVIGLLFLFSRRVLDLIGHVLLLFFIFTAYFWVPITGFGWPLAIMGLALTKGVFPRLHLAYLGALAALMAYHLPWHLVVDWLAGAA